jgi:cytochrome d ubiquinol oxidase subunit II
VFGVASIISPFFLGTAAAAAASGGIRAPGGTLLTGFFTGWNSPLALMIGLFVVAICAYLAATYLMVETAGHPALQADFRRRAMVASVASGALGLAALALAWVQAPRLIDSLTGRGLPLLVLALLNGPLALWAVWRLHPLVARTAVAAQVVLVLWALAVGQWPFLVPPDLTIAGTAAPRSTLAGMLVVTGAGMVVLLPSLWVLFRVFKARNPAAAG